LLREALKNKLSYDVHYCTAKLKDRVQLSKRIQRRAKNIAQKFDIMNNDGTLTRGVIYLPFMTPGFNYAEQLEKLTAKQKGFMRKKLLIAKCHLMRDYGVPKELFLVDDRRFRLLTNAGVVQHMSAIIKEMGLKPAIVTEYPTWDALIVELDWL
ncbi:hypothetical protein KY359_05475, partial [Candidatus Woesearchaeota archaeon]|nr:hypothetical protein [Candidatus Woesearchaeota archaeon]